MKIVAIGGSLRPHSYTYQALQVALSSIHNPAIQTELIDLRTLQLPFCDGSSLYTAFPDVEIFRQKVKSASGILLATPEYHGSLSGVLKNALDLLDIEQLGGKAVGLIAVVGGVHSTSALNTLRLICRQLHCWVLPDQLIIPHAASSFDVNGQLIDKELEERLSKMTHYLVEIAEKLQRKANH